MQKTCGIPHFQDVAVARLASCHSLLILVSFAILRVRQNSSQLAKKRRQQLKEFFGFGLLSFAEVSTLASAPFRNSSSSQHARMVHTRLPDTKCRLQARKVKFMRGRPIILRPVRVKDPHSGRMRPQPILVPLVTTTSQLLHPVLK